MIIVIFTTKLTDTDMILSLNLAEASRLQFALTAMFHWIFVPLTLGLSILIGIMETKYYLSGNTQWKNITKFWMRIFAVNFAIGLATGIILEFEFGTNWSNYSWFVGDIFGAPLAIEGILAFFMESTFFAVMYFGWDKVSKKFHLASTWLTAIGTNLSAMWILTANAWMQHPVGVEFNAETARNEMVDFWAILLSPVSVSKFFHTVTNGFVLAAVVVIGICCWYILKKREWEFSIKSIKLAAIFGLASSAVLIFTGDTSAVQVYRHQPMKFAAMEGLYEGETGSSLTAIGLLNPKKEYNNDEDPFLFKIGIPQGLSILAEKKLDTYTPGINDIIEGVTYSNTPGDTIKMLPFTKKVEMGRKAIQSLANGEEIDPENYKYFGYGYLNSPEESIPPVALTFYSFRIMVMLGCLFVVLFMAMIWATWKEGSEKLGQAKFKWLLYGGIICVPLVYICSQCGWIVCEGGRQPWTVQDLLPVSASVSGVSSSSVVVTMAIFFILFATLLVAELGIMFSQIKKGPNNE